ncbi:PIN domain-containing protein [Roseivirga pacifica]|uniref:PIN domain-containing protein n=1 Tax=Roseivirga pacifica TaxID=1267423 RepID=UPI003BB18547
MNLILLIPLVLSIVVVSKRGNHFNKDLYSSFKKSAQGYKNELKSFSISDLENDLKQLKNNIEESTLNEDSKNELLAEVCLLMGEYYSAKGPPNTTDVYENFVLAHQHAPNVMRYMELAATSLRVLKRTDKAVELAKRILKQKPHSPRAWFVMASIDDNFDSESIPSPVKRDKTYLYLVFNNLIQTNRLYDERFETLGIFEKQEVIGEIDSETIHYWILKLGVVFNRELRKHPNNSTATRNEAHKNSSYIEWCRDLSYKLINLLKGKEVIDFNPYFNQAFYFYHYSEYLLNGRSEDAVSLAKYVKLYWAKKGLETFVQTSIICLSQVGMYTELISLAEEVGIEDFGLSFLVGFTYSALDDQDKALEYLDKHFKQTDDILREDCSNIIAFFHLLYLKKINPRVYFLDNLRSKKFDSDITKSIIELNSLQYYPEPVNQELIDQLGVKLYNKKEELTVYQIASIGEVFISLKEYDRAMDFLKEIKNPEKYQVGLYLLIQCQNHLKTDHKYLLSLLEKWRLNFETRLDFLDYELSICEKSKWYDRIELVAEFGLITYPQNGSLWAYLLLSLSFQEDKKEKLNGFLTADLLELNFSSGQVSLITKVLFRAKKFDLGLNLIYEKIISDPTDSVLKSVYFSLLAFYGNNIDLLDYEVVEAGHTLKVLNGEGKESLIHLRPNILDKSSAHKAFLGKKKGETVILEKKLQDEPEKFKILSIHNKFQGLFFEIMEEAADMSKVTDYDIVSVTPKGKSLEDMNKALVEKFGLTGEKQQSIIKEAFEKYDKREIGFTELAASVARDKLYELFSDLTNDYSNGYWCLPKVLFQNGLFDKNREYVPDFPSICTLALLTDLIDFNQVSLTVPQSLIDLLRERIHQVEHMQDEPLSLSISVTKGVRPTQQPKSFKTALLNGNKKILDWILEYCQVIPSIQKLDIISDKIEEFEDTDLYFGCLIDTFTIANANNRVLISDDLNYYKGFSHALELVGVEAFVEHVFDDVFLESQMVFLKNNFKGITPSYDIMKIAFEDNPILEAPNNVFRKLLRSLNYSCHQNENVLFEVVDFMSYLFQEQLNRGFKERLSETLFIETLRSYPKDKVAPEKLIEHIDEKFNLLGNDDMAVKKALITAIRSLSTD